MVMERPPRARIIWVGVVFSAFSACADGSAPFQGLPPGPDAAGQEEAGASADGPVDAGVADARAAPGSFDGPLENCRWIGYGIGPIGAGQCFSMHLLEHAAPECGTGVLYGQPRGVPDQCVSDSDEAQVLCCFVDGVPAGLPDPYNLLPEQLVQTDPPLGRAEILARAADTCAQRSKRLGDWSVRYAVDGVTPDVFRFGCR